LGDGRFGRDCIAFFVRTMPFAADAMQFEMNMLQDAQDLL